MQRYDLEYQSVFNDSTMVKSGTGDYVTYEDCQAQNRALEVDRNFLRTALMRLLAEAEVWCELSENSAMIGEMKAVLEATK
jgi:hypothetical protein